MQKERYQSQINQNFGTICHTEVCLTFSRLAAKLSELSKKFRGHSFKIQPQMSFDLNGLKNGPSKHFESSLKSMHLFQRLMGAKKPNVLSSEEWLYYMKPNKWGHSMTTECYALLLGSLGTTLLVQDLFSNLQEKSHLSDIGMEWGIEV